MHKYMSLSIYATFFLFLILSRVILYSATTSKMSVVFLARHFLILFLVISFFFLLTLDLITFSILACACSLIPSRISAMALVPGAVLFLLHLCLSKPILCTLVSPWTGRKKRGSEEDQQTLTAKREGRTLNPLWNKYISLVPFDPALPIPPLLLFLQCIALFSNACYAEGAKHDT